MKYRVIKKHSKFVPQIFKDVTWETIGDEKGYTYVSDAVDYCKIYHNLFKVEVVTEFEL